MTNGKIRNGAQLQIASVHEGALKAHDRFFGCVKCGKIFWVGSHWDRHLGKRKESHQQK